MRKVFLLLLLTVFSFTTLFSTVHAQQGWDPLDPRFQESVAGSNEQNQMSLPSATANTTMSNAALMLCVLAGGAACAPEDSPSSSLYRNYGLIPNVQMANVAMILNQPANTGTWLADTGRSLGFLPREAHAQGIGFTGLSPVLNLWKTFRNLAYVLIAFILMVVGFMVMFRTKIDPHTVASIQLVLPRVVISLILITFSYAIVGLMIDMSYVILYLAYNLFVSAGLPTWVEGTVLFGAPTDPINTQQVYLTGSLFDNMQIIFPQGLSSIQSLLERLLGTQFTVQGAVTMGLVAGFAGGLSPLGAVGAVGGFLLGAGAPLILELLVVLLLFILIVRIFFMILSAYVQIILLTILGPIQLVLGTIPGRNNFSSWIRTVAGNISVYVVTGVLFMLSATFNTLTQNAANQAIWSPPYFPFHIMTSNVGAFFVIGILMMIPSITKQVKQSIIGENDANLAMGGAVFSGLSGISVLGMQAFNMWRSEQHNRELTKAVGGKGGQGGAPHNE